MLLIVSHSISSQVLFFGKKNAYTADKKELPIFGWKNTNTKYKYIYPDTSVFDHDIQSNFLCEEQIVQNVQNVLGDLIKCTCARAINA